LFEWRDFTAPINLEKVAGVPNMRREVTDHGPIQVPWLQRSTKDLTEHEGGKKLIVGTTMFGIAAPSEIRARHSSGKL
jgi:hypothetical protein